MNKGVRQVFGGDWTEQKLDCISKYLAAYAKVMKNLRKYFRTVVYIDAFAGTGYREPRRREEGGLPLMPELADDEPQRFLEGSVIRALKVEPKFDQYIFVEEHQGRSRALNHV
ncbi:MAG: three-Cys-motif partner protein TcmP [Armatimonadetes bacterium]|nr:three-Cys-motif partner protein TcmP [Armatimonadota bacterium]